MLELGDEECKTKHIYFALEFKVKVKLVGLVRFSRCLRGFWRDYKGVSRHLSTFAVQYFLRV